MKAKTSQARGAKSPVTERGASRRRKDQPPVTSDVISHVTPADGNIFDDLGFSPEEAENLKVRAKLMSELRDLISDFTQVEAARFLGVTQPRVSDLKRGKIGLFTIDALVNMLAHAGIKMRVTLSRPKKSAA